MEGKQNCTFHSVKASSCKRSYEDTLQQISRGIQPHTKKSNCSCSEQSSVVYLHNYTECPAQQSGDSEGPQ